MVGLIAAVVAIPVLLMLPKHYSYGFVVVLLAWITAIYGGFAFVDGRLRPLIIELAHVALMAALTFLGLWLSPLWLALGYFWHGVWDILHNRRVELIKTRIPDWYGPMCLIFDWAFAIFILIAFRTGLP